MLHSKWLLFEVRLSFYDVNRGWAVSITQVLLMASPLSTMYKAVKSRSSASFHPLLCIMGLVSSTLYVLLSRHSSLMKITLVAASPQYASFNSKAEVDASACCLASDALTRVELILRGSSAE